MTEISRRAMLSGVASLGGLVSVGSLPKAMDDATLSADVAVQDAWADDTGEIGHLLVDVSNERDAGQDPITVVGNVWGVGRMTQVPWDISSGGFPTVAPGETVEVHFIAPGEEEVVRLKPDKPGMVRIYDRGTERRAHDSFVPSEVGDK